MTAKRSLSHARRGSVCGRFQVSRRRPRSPARSPISRRYSVVPGWTFVLLALIAGAGLVLSLRSSDRSWLRLTGVAAGVSIAASFITYLQILAQSSLGLGGVGWGFVIGLFAGCILAISSRILARRTAQPTA